MDDYVTYQTAGADTGKVEIALQRIVELCKGTFDFRDTIGKPAIPIGHFSGVIDMGAGRALAIKTDGVGTKVFIAQEMEKYDTIGIDCVAMNVNDILCVGALPISMVDYIAVQEPDPDLLEAIVKGVVSNHARDDQGTSREPGFRPRRDGGRHRFEGQDHHWGYYRRRGRNTWSCKFRRP